MFLIGPYSHLPGTLYSAIQRIGLETSLQWVVDASDINSVSNGSNQTLGTIPSGGTTFTLGPSTAVDADTDPQFVGTPGGQSSGEYWETGVNAAGTATSRLESAKATWSDNAHKNNALFTYAGWVWFNPTTDGAALFDSTGGTTGTNFGISSSAFAVGANHPFLAVQNGGAQVLALQAATLTATLGTEIFFALSADEASGNFRFALNGSQELKTGTYASPNSGASTREPRVYCGSSSTPGTPGRLHNAAWWNRALSSAELTALYETTKSKFGH